MAFEMICGQCRGNLLVEQFGVVVACPHCGAHLHIPAPADAVPVAPPPTVAPTPEPISAPIEPETQPVRPSAPLRSSEPITEVTPPAPVQIEAEPASDPEPATEEMNVLADDESEPPPSVEITIAPTISVSDGTSAVIEHVTEEASTTTTEERLSLSALMSSSEPAATETPTTAPATDSESSVTSESSPAPALIEPTREPTPEPMAVSPTHTPPSGLSGLFGSSADSSPPEVTPITDVTFAAQASGTTAAESSLESHSLPHEDHAAVIAAGNAAMTPPTATKPADKDHILVSKSLVLILVSYASAITIGFLYLLYYGSANSKDYGLESLPDPVPPKRKTSGVYQETTPMPSGHDLKIGETQQFGNIKVTVIKVTREPIRFRHFSDNSKSRLPSAPVLKLWLRFTNVSDEQEIAPLDDQLLFHRIGKDRFSYHSNQFVVQAEQKENREALRVIAFDHKIGSGWDLADLPLDKPLQPGESRDYYVPTCENELDKLTGDLLWRVHIRKGYSARGNGVTTLFEVHFHSNAIRDEPA